jgi:hypothetical protein
VKCLAWYPNSKYQDTVPKRYDTVTSGCLVHSKSQVPPFLPIHLKTFPNGLSAPSPSRVLTSLDQQEQGSGLFSHTRLLVW